MLVGERRLVEEGMKKMDALWVSVVVPLLLRLPMVACT